MSARTLTLNKAALEAHSNAVNHGFYEDYARVRKILMDRGTLQDLEFFDQIWLSNRLMLIVRELAEGLEAIRNGNYSGEPKSNGLVEELADVDIRLGDLSKHVQYFTKGMDRGTAVLKKMKYNESRPRKHGKSL